MKYIMIWPYGWFDTYMYRDLTANNIVVPLNVNKPYSSRFINFLHRVHCSYKLNRMVKLPYKDIWYHSLYKSLATEIDDSACIIFDTGSLSYLSLHTLKRIKNITNNIKMVLIVVDSLHGSSAHIPYVLPKILGFNWDLTLSYDQHDCDEFGFDYMGQTIYSRLNDVKPSDAQSDIYFVGRNKAGRNQDVLKLYEYLHAAGIKVNFDLVDTKKNNRKSKYRNAPGVHLHDSNIPYEDVISNVLSTNCILEIVAPGQKVQTARYYEAVCYNKKLLTNNIGFSELPFYNPDYIHYFNRIEDIDLEWLQDQTPVEYHYNNEFSPIHLIDMINEKLHL